MAGIEYPRGLGLWMRSIPPTFISKMFKELMLERLTDGGSTNSPLGIGNRIKTVNLVSTGSLLVVILWFAVLRVDLWALQGSLFSLIGDISVADDN